MEVALPKGGKIIIHIEWTQVGDGYVTCSVTKDGGDDPDATHGAQILSTVSLNNNVGAIQIDGGQGVGRVTKPGLGLPIGAGCDKSCAIHDDQGGCFGDCREAA